MLNVRLRYSVHCNFSKFSRLKTLLLKLLYTTNGLSTFKTRTEKDKKKIKQITLFLEWPRGLASADLEIFFIVIKLDTLHNIALCIGCLVELM